MKLLHRTLGHGLNILRSKRGKLAVIGTVGGLGLAAADIAGASTGIKRGWQKDKTSSPEKKIGKAILLRGGYEGYETRKKQRGSRASKALPILFGQGYTAHVKSMDKHGSKLRALGASAAAPFSNLVQYSSESKQSRKRRR